MDLRAKRAVMVTTDRFKTIAITGLCLGLVLSGCGRKAALDIPSAASEQVPAQENGQPVEPVVQPAPEPANTGFILNPLIGR